jgi:hypothetical protein
VTLADQWREVRALGHSVTGGVTHLLPQMLGHRRAMELIVLGERQDARALKAGHRRAHNWPRPASWSARRPWPAKRLRQDTMCAMPKTWVRVDGLASHAIDFQPQVHFLRVRTIVNGTIHEPSGA